MSSYDYTALIKVIAMAGWQDTDPISVAKARAVFDALLLHGYDVVKS